MTEQTAFYAAFSHVGGLGIKAFKRILMHFGTPKKAYEAHPSRLQPFLQSLTFKNYSIFRVRHTPHSIVKNLLQKDIQILSPDMPEWPELLRHIPSFPICLYLKGNKNIFLKQQQTGLPSLAIVGSRKPTAYGSRVASEIATECAGAGILVVSGMAAGIDADSHKANLKNNGATVAVLGCGVDIVYPPRNIDLYNEILAKNGAIISEYLPGQVPLPGLFARRNRIISGLCDGVLVVEGNIKSGTRYTARHASDQGRAVFAVPSSIYSPASHTPHELIRTGATLIRSARDIFEEFHIKYSATRKAIPLLLTSQEKILFDYLKEHNANVDELTEQLSLSIADALSSLTELEIKGYIAKNDMGEYHIRTP